MRGAGHLPGCLHPCMLSNYSHMQKYIILVIRKIMNFSQFLFFYFQVTI